MNFCSQGFYEEDQNQLPHKNLVPLAFHQRGSSGSNSWLENKYENHRRTSAADEISSNTIRYYNSTGAAVPANLELMEASPSFRNNSDDDHEGGGANSGVGGLVVEVEREHMFDKVVTPSDVGKLNRLVIPKQHAEKYFPLDSSSNDKGLLLNFEDRNGKPWRFRYSYWNSSQSYVMTKGWSRFVKEKKLDAGDIVSFQRGLGELGRDRLFIDWRRRPEIPPQGLIIHPPSPLPQHYLSFQRMSTTQPPSATTAPLFFQPQAQFRDYTHFHNHQHNHPNSSAYNQPHHSPSSSYGYGYGGIGGPYATYNSSSSTTSHPYSSSVIYLRSAAATHVSPPQVQAGMVQLQSTGGGGGGGGSMDIGSGIGIGIGSVPMVFESVPVVRGKAAAKRLRLFGVNMDCPIAESDECDILSSTTTMPNAATMAPPWPSHPPPYLSSSSSSNIPPLQLRLYNGNPLPTMHPDKGNKSNKSFDLDI